MKTVAQTLAQLCQAVANCERSNNTEWRKRHEDNADFIAKQFLPSGSGVDCGTKIDWDATLRNPRARLVLTLSFHHMNECGMYDGWTEHRVTVRPDWDGTELTISGRDRNQVKEYLHEILSYDLGKLIRWDNGKGEYVLAE